jgi:hypothetical protein
MKKGGQDRCAEGVEGRRWCSVCVSALALEKAGCTDLQMRRSTEKITQDYRERAAELQAERGRLQGWRGRSIEQMTQDCREHVAELQAEGVRLQGWEGRLRVMRVEGEVVVKRQAGPVENGVTLQMQTGQKGPEV